MKIVHITSAHPSLDIRIFYKECRALHSAGHEVHLIAPESQLAENQGIKIHALNSKSPLSRLQRLKKIYQLAKNIPADIYHFHDPEFIPFAFLLKLRNCKVIYDVHEDTPRESLSFNKNRPLVALLKFARWTLLEKTAKLFFDGFVCATPHIAKNFPEKKTVTVRNYVNIDEFILPATPFRDRPNTALYVGGVMAIRGLNEMVQAINMLPVHYNANLRLVGNFSPRTLQKDAEQIKGWNKVTSINWLTRDQLLPQFYSSKIGLVLLHPESNFKMSLPIKLFEYMAAGLPVIASDFPLWREIIEKAKCGFLVNPLNLHAIKNAMTYLFDHPEEAEEMGKRGREAVMNEYNWQKEAATLTSFYNHVMS